MSYYIAVFCHGTRLRASSRTPGALGRVIIIRMSTECAKCVNDVCVIVSEKSGVL